MSLDPGQLRSGKAASDENFPVASWLIGRRNRLPIFAFYEFVRIADDIADHPTLDEREKLEHLDRLEGSLLGQNSDSAAGIRLGSALRERALSPQYAQELLRAFRQDVHKHRYNDWQELIEYCRYSAMPVGRFVLEVHGEDHALWSTADNVCAALQLINHLQDCGADYRNLNRVYVPLDALAASGATVEALGASRSDPQLLNCLHQLAERTSDLLELGAGLPAMVEDRRLALEVSATIALARRFVNLLRTRDPLGERVRLSKFEMARLSAISVIRELFARITRR